MSYSDQQELLFGDMELERELGEGGMGKVQLVRSRSTGERFAVKRTKFRDWAGQRNFLLELMTWYGLPRHPHLVECCFFHTLQNDKTGESEIAIFAEYVPGGSLAHWIADRKLTRLDQILDVAIQFAWGLHAAHELGVIHQDVKPANAILTSEGIVKVADFGLARARARAGEETSPDSAQSILVSSGGMTQAYCSPEQFAGERLTRKTDIWSWGVSILDMFTGKPNKSIGARADRVVLTEYLDTGADDPRLPPMPAGLVEILGACFRDDPSERWATMAEVTDALRDVYQKLLGQEYPRPLSPAPDQSGPQVIEHDRWTTGGVQWRDPLESLAPALEAEGRNPGEAEALLVRAIARKAQPIADLIGYEEARRILERPMAGGFHIEAGLAWLCREKALIHLHVGDAPGAMALYHGAITIFERLVEQEGQDELANDLAITYQNTASALCDLGNVQRGVALYDQAIAVYEELVLHDGRPELANELAGSYQNKAVAIGELGDRQGAVALHDRAIAIRERLVREGRDELANDLARSYANKAVALRNLWDLPGAVVFHNQAIAIYERLVHQGRHELEIELAGMYQNKAIALANLGNLRGAVALHDRAIAIRERLVREGRDELANDLARSYQNKAVALRSLGDVSGALALYDEAIAVRERLVHHQGRSELAKDLAETYQNKANALGILGDLWGAVALCDRAILVYERLVQHEGRRELARP